MLGLARRGPFVGVNLGAMEPSLASSELFGSVRGAFTGAVRDRLGFFRTAKGGTLFLDEIGEAPPEVQVMLLRALEIGEILPVGSQTPVPVDVRVVAATDSDLEDRSQGGNFRAPLLHRLSGYVLWLPSLAERRDDFGVLMVHFLRQALVEIGEEERLATPADASRPWLSASVVRRLLDYSWPGNVRQLRNVVHQLVIGSRGRSSLRLGPETERLLRTPEGVGGGGNSLPDASDPGGLQAPSTGREKGPSAPERRPGDVRPEELVEALRRHRWELAAAARHLGISRPSLYNLIRDHPQLRTAGDVDAEEIRRCHRQCDGELEAMADRLEVSASALRRRVRELGLV